jgi:hypothetical protein
MVRLFRSPDDSGSGGANANPGGEGEKNPANTEKSATVARDAYERVLSEKKKLQEQHDALKAESKKLTEAKLTEDQQWKALAEARAEELKAKDGEIQEWKGKYTGLDRDVTETRKLQSVLGKLPGKVDSAYWDLIPLDKVAVDPETGKVDEASLAKVVKEFETKHARLIDKPGSKLPNEAARGGQGPLTYETWLTLPIAEKKARYKEVFDNDK